MSAKSMKKSKSKSKKSKINTMGGIISYLKNSWWALMITAIFVVLVGVYAVFFPDATIEFITAFFGAFMFLGGIFSVIRSFAGNRRFSLFNVVVGVIAFVFGIFVIRFPEVFQSALVYIAAIILLIKSLFDLKLADGVDNGVSIWLVVSGILGILASIFLFISPAISGIVIIFLLGVYAIVFGIISIIDLVSARRKFSKLIKK